MNLLEFFCLLACAAIGAECTVRLFCIYDKDYEQQLEDLYEKYFSEEDDDR